MSIELDITFFQMLIRKYFSDDTIILDVCEDSKPEITNFIAQVKRYSLNGTKKTNGNSQDFKFSVIVKENHANPNFNLDQSMTNLYFQNEIVAYKSVLPKLNETLFQRNRFKLPDILYMDGQIIVMEDLALGGYKPNTYLQFLEIKTIKSTLTQLARLHSASIILKYKNPKLFQEFIDVQQEWTGLHTSHASKLLETSKIFEQLVPNKQNNQIIEMLQDLATSYESKIKCLLHDERMVKVLVHGDLSPQNILANCEDNKVAIIDYQTMRYSSVAIDLNTLFHLSMPLEQRNLHLRGLLQCYLDELHLCMDVLPENECNKGLTLEWLLNEYNEFRLYGYVICLWQLPLRFYSPSSLALADKQHQVDFFVQDDNQMYKNAVIELTIDYYNHQLH